MRACRRDGVQVEVCQRAYQREATSFGTAPGGSGRLAIPPHLQTGKMAA